MPFLDWVNKNQAVSAANAVPYHLLQLQQHFGDAGSTVNSQQSTVNSQQSTNNLIIQGDNLQALKALLPFYTGKVKCIFIDPPYNTGSAFEHYDDKLEHSQWLTMMYPRLVLLRDLLADDGSIWVSIDDSEAQYLKVLMDEIFGRNCLTANVVWRSSDAANNDAKTFSLDHNHIIVFSKNLAWLANPLARTDDSNAHYKNPDNDPNGAWFMGNLSSPKPRPNLRYTIQSPNGHIINSPANGWRWQQSTMNQMIETGEIIFSQDGKRVIKKTYLKDQSGLSPSTMWDDLEETGHNRQAKYELKKLFPDVPTSELFSTPKPEKLLSKILTIATNPNDLILDSFLGSGTTAAVAHKMNRRYIGIEMGEHAKTHCIPRLEKVIAGEQGGISKAVNWAGGGGFSFYTLGEAVFDAEGHISQAVRFNALAAYIWLLETKTALHQVGAQFIAPKHEPNISNQGVINPAPTPFIGAHDGIAYYLLYNGILGDRRPNGGNVLTSSVLAHLNSVHTHTGKKVIFGEASRLGAAKLAAENISFKQIPYELHESIG
jgi:adenine-specific DNA-methyltransferase